MNFDDDRQHLDVHLNTLRAFISYNASFCDMRAPPMNACVTTGCGVKASSVATVQDKPEVIFQELIQSRWPLILVEYSETETRIPLRKCIEASVEA